MTSKRNKLEDLLQHLDSSTAMQQRMPDAVRERILNDVIKEANDARVEAPRKSDSAHPAIDPVRRTRRWQWPAVAAAVAAIVMAVILPTLILQGAPAVLEDAEGKRSIQYGEFVRPAGDTSAMLSMADGPQVETRSMSEFSLEPTDDGGTRIRLEEGVLIVDASAENSANLYVQTKDTTALVSGGVSLVKAEEEGSRIAVISGAIRVQEGTTYRKLRPGEHVATSPGMELVPVKEEVAWSRQAAAHVAMLESAPTMYPSPAGPLKFATVSVRPVQLSIQTAPLIRGIRCLGVDGLLGARPGVEDPTARRGRCTGQVVALSNIVSVAYASSSKFNPLWDSMVGYPPSLEGTYIQIEAVSDDPERVTKSELKLMLQTLLEDRFKARVHLETRELDGHVLTIAKSGIKFKETSGHATGQVIGSRTRLNGKYGIEGVTFFLTVMFGRPYLPIADNTGLEGIYDIAFYLEEIPTAGAAAAPRGARDGAPQPRQFTTPIPKALEDQLGLHLERAKVPVEFVVIDHLELPTEN